MGAPSRTDSSSPPLRIAVLGSPSAPVEDWSDDNLTALANAGFTAVQLNIAWSYRPNDEPLNLEDVCDMDSPVEARSVAGRAARDQRRERLRLRASVAKAAGLRTMFHFGAPYNGRFGFDGLLLPQCILDPDTVDRYVRALARFAEDFPQIDDLLLYTYDQDAWVCSEFGDCTRCAGVPLHLRLPQFVSQLAAQWHSTRANGRLWWEPWELSAGQALSSISSIDGSCVGLMLHNTIAEVMSTNGPDRFVKNAASVACELGIPVVVEVFMTSGNEEVEPWANLPVPLVTWRQLAAAGNVRGVVGLKEYFGLHPERVDVNLRATLAWFKNPQLTEDQLLAELSGGFDDVDGRLRTAWRLASSAYETLPWDASWFMRQLGRSDPAHDMRGAFIRGTQSAAAFWDTPAWQSTRRSAFMQTANDSPHPWLLEDVERRCALAADLMTAALDEIERVEPQNTPEAGVAILAQITEMAGFVTRARAYQFHLRETNIAEMLRNNAVAQSTSVALWRELGHTLQLDRENQLRELARARTSDDESSSTVQDSERWVVPKQLDTSGIDRAIAKLKSDPRGFLDRYLVRSGDDASRGQFSLTSR